MIIVLLAVSVLTDRLVFPVPDHPDYGQTLAHHAFNLNQSTVRQFAYGCRARAIGLDSGSAVNARRFGVELHIVYQDGSDKWFTPKPLLDPSKGEWQVVHGIFDPPRAIRKVDFYGRLAQKGAAEFADIIIEELPVDVRHGDCSVKRGKDMVTIENDFLSFAVLPGEGGSGVSLVSKRDGVEYAVDESRHRMFQDRFRTGGNTSRRAYTLEIVRETADEVEIALGVTNPSGVNFIEIEKHFRLSRDSAALEVEYRYRNLPEAMSEQVLEPWFKSTFAPVKAMRQFFYIPTAEGVKRLDTGMGDVFPEGVIGGWVAAGDDRAHTMAVNFDYSHLAKSYFWLGGIDNTTVEWGFMPVKVAAGGVFSTSLEFLPIGGMTRPDWVANGVAAEFADCGGELVVKIAAAKTHLLSAELEVSTARGKDRRAKAIKTMPGETLSWRTGLAFGDMQRAGLRLRSDGTVVFEAERSLEKGHVYRPQAAKAKPAEVKPFKLTLSDEVKSEAIPWAKPYAGGKTRALFVISIGQQREIVELAERMDLDARTIRIAESATGNMWAMIERFSSFSFEDSNLSLKGELADAPEVIVVSGGVWKRIDEANRARIRALVENGAGLVAIGNHEILPAGCTEVVAGAKAIRDWIAAERLLFGVDRVRTYSKGAGRVVEFDYNARDGLTPFVGYDDVEPKWRYWEPMLATLARAVLWSAKKDLPPMKVDLAALDAPVTRPVGEPPVGIDEIPFEIGVSAFGWGMKRYLTPLRIAQERRNGVNLVRIWNSEATDGQLREYSGYGFTFNSTITDFRIGDGPFQKNFSEPYAKTGEKKYLERRPCFSDLGFVEKDLRRIEKVIDRALRHQVGHFNCGDENTLTLWGAPFDFCRGEHCLKAFREWLKGKYRDLADLNAKWGTAFADWDAVVPDTTVEATERAKRTGRRAYGAWADHRRFMELVFCGHIRKVKDLIDRKAPGIPFDMSGTQPANGWTGMDFWLLSDVIDIQCAYDHEHQDEVIRSFGHPLILPWYGYGDSGSKFGYRLWNDAFRFLNYGVAFFSETNFLLPDYSTPKTVLIMNETLKDLREGGARLLRSLAIDEEALVHYSQASTHAAQIEKRYPEYIAARDEVVKKLTVKGVPYRFISYAEIENGVLGRTSAKTLILPASSALSAKEAASIREFAKRGGKVVGDALSGVFDEHCRLLPKSQIADVVDTAYDWGELPADGVSAFRWRSNRGLGGRYFGFTRSPESSGGASRWVDLGRKAFVYDFRNKTCLGYTDRFKVALEPSAACLYAALPYEVRGVSADAVREGELVRVGFEIAASDRVTTLHPVRIEIYSPDGRLRGGLSGIAETADGHGSFAFRPDAAGEWRIVVTDCISGRGTVSRIEI